jgi:hypothetical protein
VPSSATENALARWRQRNQTEVVRGIEVVFAGFVDDAELAVGSGLIVRHDLVELSRFQRRGTVHIVDADGEQARPRAGFSHRDASG